jgi:hypothetical protein
MFDSLGNFLQVASGILVITSLAGLGLMRATVVNLRESLADLRSEVADKDRQNADMKADRARDKADLEALKRIVTGEDQLLAISEKLDTHHAAAITHWEADEELLGRVLQALNSGGKP